MLKELAVAGVLVLAAGCGSGGAKPTAQGNTMRDLVTKLAPIMPCDPSRDDGGYLRADCNNGSAFIEVFPDADHMGGRLLTTVGAGDYMLVADDLTWCAKADMAEDLAKMKVRLGGRTLHIEYRDPQ